MSAGFGKFENRWYRPVTGIPTGGHISVPVANIAVFFALYMSLFSQPEMLKNIVSTIKFLDDRYGVFDGTTEDLRYGKMI